MFEYGLRRVALRPDPLRLQRDPWDFHRGLLDLDYTRSTRICCVLCALAVENSRVVS